MTAFKIKYMRAGVHIICTLFASRTRKGPFEMLGNFNCNEREFLDIQQVMQIPFESREVIDEQGA